MNVGQLIKKLSKYNPKRPVVVSGYEDGETLVIGVEELKVTYQPRKPQWEGEYKVEKKIGE